MDRLTEMEAFIAVVDQGGFTDAARKLGLSKSAISKYISSLELRLGARLLDRTTRRVSPTDIGLAYYDRARRVVSDAVEADTLVTAMQEPPAGPLRISVETDFGVRRLMPVLREFVSKYPEITVNVVLGNRHVELIAEGFDLAVRQGETSDPALNVHRLADTTRKLIAAPSYLERHGAPPRIDDLNTHKLLHYSSESGGNVWTITAPSGEKRLVRAGGWLTVNDGASLLDACVAGLGIAWLPAYVYADALRDGLVQEVIPGLPNEVFAINAITPPSRQAPPKVRALIDYLVVAFAENGPDNW